jgi:hypothetical protein
MTLLGIKQSIPIQESLHPQLGSNMQIPLDPLDVISHDTTNEFVTFLFVIKDDVHASLKR